MRTTINTVIKTTAIATATLIFAAVAQAETLKLFSEDTQFLEKHTDAVVLTSPDSDAAVIVVPEMQGRVMTSTTSSKTGQSYGWINNELIAQHKHQPHINAYGGEDRLWLGPEGGQFSIFFKANQSFDLKHWQTPALIDSEAFAIDEQTKDSISFSKSATLTNYSNTQFNFTLKRKIQLLSQQRTKQYLSLESLSGADLVAFESVNQLINTGKKTWKKESGLLSLWVLGMFMPSEQVTVVIPFQANQKNEKAVNDNYFGEQPSDRLTQGKNAIYFKGDGQYRGKIGVNQKFAKDVLASYDGLNKVLTIVQYNKPKVQASYVNSAWEIQKNPYQGDVINAYNDGAPTPGAKALGPFYELESSSPAVELSPQKAVVHIHRTFHFTGTENQLNTIANAVLGVSLDEISTAFEGKK